MDLNLTTFHLRPESPGLPSVSLPAGQVKEEEGSVSKPGCSKTSCISGWTSC